MCYGPNMSASFFILGILTAIYISKYNPELQKTHITMIILFYTLMELLQTIQYRYVNLCDNKMNVALTEVAYLLVILQPLMWNYYFYLNSNASEKKLFLSAMALALCWIVVNVSARVMHNKTNELPKSMSILASDKVCTKQQSTHLYWEWTFANFGDLNANFLMYLMIWFIPALASSQASTSIILMLSAAFSALMVYQFKEPFTFTSAWCYISVPIVLIVVFYNLLRRQLVK